MNNKKKMTKWLAPLAACLVLLVAATAIVGSRANGFPGGVLKATAGENDTLSFYRAALPGAAQLDLGFDEPVTSKELTANEIESLFGDLPVTSAHGILRTADSALLHMEARAGDLKIVLAAPGIPLTDTVIDTTNRKTSTVDGVPVSAGYFVTDHNSKGIRNIIYFASFQLDGLSVYVELGDAKSESDRLKTEITAAIESILQNGLRGASQIAA